MCPYDRLLPKKMAYGKLYSDRWAHVGPKKQYNDILKTSKKNCSIGVANWEKIVADHTAWCSQVSTGTANMEQKTKKGCSTVQRHDMQSVLSPSDNQSKFACPQWNMVLDSHWPVQPPPKVFWVWQMTVWLSSVWWTNKIKIWHVI